MVITIMLCLLRICVIPHTRSLHHNPGCPRLAYLRKATNPSVPNKCGVILSAPPHCISHAVSVLSASQPLIASSPALFISIIQIIVMLSTEFAINRTRPLGLVVQRRTRIILYEMRRSAVRFREWASH
ncbi:hypothetical protein COCSADRAFT_236679 [Bipolaris sorokiniana ND90Pr]|uniref:Secreted protein n=1 Tax=Cochliobolus sativus (strain ND90Pr / ATCC 201652) TaxID=665912 RepID=M2S0S8_COCSN|nr:uncharacterized protein COCSADRAFT_236679 [Bipolaris sorokiniana ND90Pr]EMD60858.1 hypothetical protein COCSADRAFT_236679 [Bipolaris sorokiniana ND90Pr]